MSAVSAVTCQHMCTHYLMTRQVVLQSKMLLLLVLGLIGVSAAMQFHEGGVRSVSGP